MVDSAMLALTGVRSRYEKPTDRAKRAEGTEVVETDWRKMNRVNSSLL